MSWWVVYAHLPLSTASKWDNLLYSNDEEDEEDEEEK